MIYGDIKEQGGMLVVLKGRKEKGPSKMATQCKQFCFICALRTKYNYILEKDRNQWQIQDFPDRGHKPIGGANILFDQFFPKSA